MSFEKQKQGIGWGWGCRNTTKTMIMRKFQRSYQRISGGSIVLFLDGKWIECQ